MTYTISDVSKMMNLPVSTIRYYDKEGLLPFIERKKSGYRIFSEYDVKMLEIIECFKKTGMSIKEIRQFIDWVKEGDESLEKRYQLFLSRKKAVQQEMDNLQKQLDLIEHKLWYYKTALDAGTEDIHQ